MARGEALNPRYAIGVGARRGVSAQDVIAVVKQATQACEIDLREAAIFALESKSAEIGLKEAARDLGVELYFLPLDALRARKARSPTHSPRVQAMFGVGSVAEAAALVGAGAGSRLLAPRLTSPTAACAIAIRGEGDEP